MDFHHQTIVRARHTLKKQAPGLLGLESIKWNFTKFLIDKKGQVKDRFAPQTKPQEIASAIEKLLAK